ncbi:unnamed protein product [Periconia digitata]|uniref:Uncharacterized protein n=1 Tax=Periconia digitata TaxID=1303443 RepID=A0A9W4UQP9_9PLEO|nr:unnamed protein product [Periconia digitata]
MSPSARSPPRASFARMARCDSVPYLTTCAYMTGTCKGRGLGLTKPWRLPAPRVALVVVPLSSDVFGILPSGFTFKAFSTTSPTFWVSFAH